MAQVVEHLSSKSEALCLNSSTWKKKKDSRQTKSKSHPNPKFSLQKKKVLSLHLCSYSSQQSVKKTLHQA
jgi:hypothetical protein